jgi:hypothetical protein
MTRSDLRVRIVACSPTNARLRCNAPCPLAHGPWDDGRGSPRAKSAHCTEGVTDHGRRCMQMGVRRAAGLYRIVVCGVLPVGEQLGEVCSGARLPSPMAGPTVGDEATIISAQRSSVEVQQPIARGGGAATEGNEGGGRPGRSGVVQALSLGNGGQFWRVGFQV